ncbi:MAG: hypothetical protein EOO61_05060 [Hymenobacter sp.]|nr:MAG: hypothetical protein EOO61_05060 [Hymenobacter sp.]
MLTIQEQIQEINDRLQYWEKEVEELAAIGKAEEIADVYQEAVNQVNLCIDELVYLQDELNSNGELNTCITGKSERIKVYSLRFYADGPGGLLNKLFCYPVHHGRHTADLLMRFIRKGLTIKSAFVVGGAGGDRGVQLGLGELAYLTCTGEKEQARIRAILLSKFPRLS